MKHILTMNTIYSDTISYVYICKYVASYSSILTYKHYLYKSLHKI